MSAAPHLLLPFKRTTRYARWLSFLMILGIPATVYALFAFHPEREFSLPVLGIFVVGILFAEALPLRKPALSTGDGIRLNGEGLAYSRGDRMVQWSWAEVGEPRLRSWLHPASLFLGRFMTLDVPSDERRSKFGFRADRLFLRGGRIAIGDDYASRVEDIRSQIDYFRSGRSPGRSRSGNSPEPMWTSRRERKQAKFWQLASLVLGPAVGVGLGSIIMHGLPTDLDIVESWETVSAPVLGALVGVPFFIIMLLKQESIQDNMLSMSAGGLSVRHKMERRYWRWPEIYDLRIKESVSRGKDGASACIISFRAMHDGSDAGRKSPQADAPRLPVSCSVEDDYEMPIQEIARHAGLWMDWRMRILDHDGQTMAGGFETGNTLAAPGISFRRSPGQLQSKQSLLEALLPWFWMLPLIASSGLLIWNAKFGGGSLLSSLPWWGALAGFFVIMFLPLIAMLAMIAPALNRLELSQDELAMVRFGRESRWAWVEVGAVELRQVRTKWSGKQRPVLSIALPKAGLGSRYLRWAHNLDDLQTIAVLEDIYDTPLEEIRQAIDDYRRQYGMPPRAFDNG